MDTAPSKEFMKKFQASDSKKFSGGNKGGGKTSKLAEQLKKSKKK